MAIKTSRRIYPDSIVKELAKFREQFKELATEEHITLPVVTIEEVEECSEKELSEREKYWIEFYHSFHDGYNATTGGDGKQYADYDLIYKLFQEGKTCKEIKQITNYDGKTIQRALELNGVDEQTRKERGRDSFRKRVAKIDLNTNEILEVYTSIREAEKANGQTRHIGDVCNGRRKSCKGFGWKFLEN